MELRVYLEALRRRWMIVALTAVATVVCVTVGSLSMTPVYSAAALVRIAEGSDGTRVDYAELNYADRMMNTYTQLLVSRPFMQQVVQRLKLPVDPQTLSGTVKVDVLRNTELIRITVESTSPAQAASVANMLSALVIEEKQRLFSGSSRTSADIIQEQLALVLDGLKKDRARLEELKAGAAVGSAAGVAAPTAAGASPQAAAGTVGGTAVGQPPALEELTSRIAVQEQTYSMLLAQYDKIRVDESLRANSVSIVEEAVVPQAPIRPKTPLYLALGVLIGVLGGIGLALLIDHLDPSIHTVEQLESVVADLGAGGESGWIPISTIPLHSRYQVALSSSFEASTVDPAFRALAVNTLSVTRSNAPKSFLVTSADPGTGKSTIVANLAVALARAGKRVVAVDADAANPTLYSLFGLAGKMGIGGDLTRDDEMGLSPQSSGIMGVKLMTLGSVATLSPELLASHQLRAVIERLSSSADVIIVDGPPVLASADAVALARSVDGVLLVTAQDQSTTKQLEFAVKPLANSGCRVLGIVFNRATRVYRDYFNTYISAAVSGPAGETAPAPANGSDPASSLRGSRFVARDHALGQD